MHIKNIHIVSKASSLYWQDVWMDGCFFSYLVTCPVTQNTTSSFPLRHLEIITDSYGQTIMTPENQPEIKQKCQWTLSIYDVEETEHEGRLEKWRIRNVEQYDQALFFTCLALSLGNDTVKQEVVLCSAVQCSAVQCSAVQCSAVQCSTVWCSAEKCSAVWYGVVWWSVVVWCSTVWCSAEKCSAVQCGMAWGGEV